MPVAVRLATVGHRPYCTFVAGAGTNGEVAELDQLTYRQAHHYAAAVSTALAGAGVVRTSCQKARRNRRVLLSCNVSTAAIPNAMPGVPITRTAGRVGGHQQPVADALKLSFTSRFFFWPPLDPGARRPGAAGVRARR